MKMVMRLAVIGILITICSLPGRYGMPAEQAPVVVLNPLGEPPPIQNIPMAPRLDTLEGKTIYIVDVMFAETHQFLEEMQKLLAAKYPKTNWIMKNKAGTYFDDDPKLWAEIKAKGNGMIIGIGH